MRKIIIMTMMVSSMVYSFFAEANYDRCRWTAEGTNSRFKSDAMYSQPPKIVSPASCGGSPSSNDISLVKPTCIGQIYCESPNPYSPPQVIFGGCLAVKVNEKWICPTASVCAADINVIVEPDRKVPSIRVAPSSDRGQGALGTGSADGGQGVGGR